jgi:hypothetical protein
LRTIKGLKLKLRDQLMQLAARLILLQTERVYGRIETRDFFNGREWREDRATTSRAFQPIALARREAQSIFYARVQDREGC